MQLSGDGQVSVRTIFPALDILKTPTSKTTEPSLLIVLADIRLIVPPDRGPEVLGGPDRPFSVSKVGGHVSDGGGGGVSESRRRVLGGVPHLTIPEEALPMVVSFGLMNFT